MIDDDLVRAHRARGAVARSLRDSRHRPEPGRVLPGEETVNPFYLACPAIVQDAMDKLGDLTGRRYRLFDYAAAPRRRAGDRADGFRGGDGPGDSRAPGGPGRESRRAQGPALSPVSSAEYFLAALPATVRTLAVLDRTKEPGQRR